MKVFRPLLRRIVDFTLCYPRLVLIFGTLVTALAFYGSQKIEIRSNFSDLLPDSHPAVLQARELEKTVGGASFIVVAVETKDPLAADRFLTDLHEKISKENLEGIRFIDDRPPTSFFRKQGLLYLSVDELRSLKSKIKKRIQEGKLKKNPFYIDLDGAAEADDFSSTLTSLRDKYHAFLNSSPRYQNKAGTLFVSLIKPAWQTTDVARTAEFADIIQQVIQSLDPVSYHPSLSVRLTGPYIKTMTQKKILIRDAIVVSLISLVGAIAYLFFHFRKKRAVFLIAVPLSASVIWSLGFAYLFFGSLNLFSSVACAVLMGLAADYGIHVYSEYVRHRLKGEEVVQALRLAILQLAKTFFAASSTTAAAFFALTLTRFKALHEFGWIAGIGVLLCGLAFILFMPPLALLIERRWPVPAEGLTPRIRSWKLPKSSPQFSLHHLFSAKGLVLSSLLLLTPLLLVIGGNLRFDYDFNHIMGQQETKGLDREVDSIFNHTVNPEVALVQKTSDAPRLTRAIREAIKKHPAGETTIKEVLTLQDFVPTYQKQKRKMIRSIRNSFTPLVVKSLNAEERRSYEEFKTLLNPSQITRESVPTSIQRIFEDRQGQVGRLVLIFPNFEMQQTDRFMRFVEEVRSIPCPDCEGTFYASGESTVYYEIVKMLFREGKYVIGFALGTVLLALWLNFRSIRATLIVFSPLAVGLASTLGWMTVTGMQFNIINLAALPIILGTADDYAVHYYHRHATHKKEGLFESYRISFLPILGGSLTTLIGFGSLSFANIGGIRSMGLLCSLGIFLCCFTTLAWFPALLSFLEREKELPTSLAALETPVLQKPGSER